MGKQRRDLLTPVFRGQFDLADKGGLSFWKQIIPLGQIDYEGEPLVFDRPLHREVLRAFRSGAMDQVTFLLANDANEHHMNAEKVRGLVTKMRTERPGEDPGVYAKVDFPNRKAAKAIINNPGLGVSCRLEEFVRRKGREFKANVVHVLGTLDPKVTGMSPWQPVDLSRYDSGRVVIDLSSASYKKESTVAKKGDKDKAGNRIADLANVTGEQAVAVLDKMSDKELEALIGELEESIDADDDSSDDDKSKAKTKKTRNTSDPDDDVEDDDEDDEDDEDDDEDDDVEDAADDQPKDLSRKAQRQLDLANAAAQRARTDATAALTALAQDNWDKTKAALARRGVPPAILDLSEPLLNSPAKHTIDLSNTPGKKLNVGKRVERILEEMAGFIEMGTVKGHGQDLSGGDQGPLSADDKATLEQWRKIHGS